MVWKLFRLWRENYWRRKARYCRDMAKRCPYLSYEQHLWECKAISHFGRADYWRDRLNGYNDFAVGIRVAMQAVDDLRVRSAANFTDDNCKGQRGQDRTDALYDAYKEIEKKLRRKTTA